MIEEWIKTDKHVQMVTIKCLQIVAVVIQVKNLSINVHMDYGRARYIHVNEDDVTTIDGLGRVLIVPRECYSMLNFIVIMS